MGDCFKFYCTNITKLSYPCPYNLCWCRGIGIYFTSTGNCTPKVLLELFKPLLCAGGLGLATCCLSLTFSQVLRRNNWLSKLQRMVSLLIGASAVFLSLMIMPEPLLPGEGTVPSWVPPSTRLSASHFGNRTAKPLPPQLGHVIVALCGSFSRRCGGCFRSRRLMPRAVGTIL